MTDPVPRAPQMTPAAPQCLPSAAPAHRNAISTQIMVGRSNKSAPMTALHSQRWVSRYLNATPLTGPRHAPPRTACPRCAPYIAHTQPSKFYAPSRLIWLRGPWQRAAEARQARGSDKKNER
jgi:hypothetical protein